MDTKELWDNVLVEAELNVSKATFNTWFSETYVLKEEGGVVYVSVPNEFVKTWLLEKYHKFILKTLRNLLESVRSVEYVVTREKPENKEVAQGKFSSSANQGSLPLNDVYINKDDNLNPRYVFESFVVGPFNELAYAASQAILKSPGAVYNPFFVYGKTGCGKTHLIQSVGNQIKKTYSNTKVFYVTSEKFVVDYLNSVHLNKVNLFKEKYRKYDVLIMDDIQFLSKKEKTQEELFHLFNTLYDNNKQIIFSSDMHPNFLQNMEERLKSRFSAGMVVDISPPDYESRMAILKAKANQHGMSLTSEIIDYIASVVGSNIRELEGILNILSVQSQMKDKELTLSDVKTLIRNSIKSRRSAPVEDIIKMITEFYNIEEESVYKKTRKKEIVKPRQIIMYILREDYNIPYPTIGQKLGGRDHTTVIHSYEKIKKDLETDSVLAQEIHQIRGML
ncbi:chromosomal replication initiator protein DnaA [Candidatus Campbellbacteria bacterium CG22_combo_CG10-13_8_21_14_all_36_13]|uniref:Chromosomal replication initiator protein DnaA n=1 Tax=Candidatus Campbellbacteria bacterium CG22_combo_CG10-13_8_21_14_all_36_13 TaxID=1974529 RepID=A0A2H0DZ45_9BACT|nr:MAG: chromosomal replication initiator protein DnaA [Candidatus Campbellbacteria bacterium CG22_combo_CG10-13_8_21_14_all_36_13]